MAKESSKIMTAFIAVIVGVALISPLQGFANDANVSGSVALIVSLIPLFFALAILYTAIRSMIGGV